MTRRGAEKSRKEASQERSRATVAALVEATARILVSDGFDKTTTNRIAEVAGVSIGSLYQYFPNKEALVAAVVERHNRDIMRATATALAQLPSLAIEDAVRLLISVAIKAHQIDPALHRVLSEQIPRIGTLEDAQTALSEAQANFAEYLERRSDELGVADVPIASFIAATSIEAVAHNAVLNQGHRFSNEAFELLTDEATRLILGFLKPV